MLGATNWNEVGALVGLVGLSMTIAGFAATRARKRVPLRVRVSRVEDNMSEIKGALVTEPPTDLNPHPEPKLLDRFGNLEGQMREMKGQMTEVLTTVRRIDRNGNGHS